MKQLKGQFPVGLMSRVFDVCKSGYYAWLKRGPSQHTQDDARLSVAINHAPALIPTALDFTRGWGKSAPTQIKRHTYAAAKATDRNGYRKSFR